MQVTTFCQITCHFENWKSHQGGFTLPRFVTCKEAKLWTASSRITVDSSCFKVLNCIRCNIGSSLVLHCAPPAQTQQSSEGEMRWWFDWLASHQPATLNEPKKSWRKDLDVVRAASSSTCWGLSTTRKGQAPELQDLLLDAASDSICGALVEHQISSLLPVDFQVSEESAPSQPSYQVDKEPSDDIQFSSQSAVWLISVLLFDQVGSPSKEACSPFSPDESILGRSKHLTAKAHGQLSPTAATEYAWSTKFDILQWGNSTIHLKLLSNLTWLVLSTRTSQISPQDL